MDCLYVLITDMKNNIMKNNITIFLLLIISMISCDFHTNNQDNEESGFVNLHYYWQGDLGGAKESRLIVTDSTLVFYPECNIGEYVQIYLLNHTTKEHILTLANKVVNSVGRQAAVETNSGIKLHYKINLNPDPEITGEASPIELNDYLLSLLSDCSAELISEFSIPVVTDSVCNNDSWTEVELRILGENQSDIRQRLVVRNDTITLQYQHQHQIKTILNREDSILLSDIISRINRNVNFIYWDKAFEQNEFSYVNYGIELLINGESVALTSGAASMPTRPLRQLFGILYRLSPAYLKITVGCYDADYIISEDDEAFAI